MVKCIHWLRQILVTSRRLVFTLSPGFLGTSDGATTTHMWTAHGQDLAVQVISRRPGFVTEVQFSAPAT